MKPQYEPLQPLISFVSDTPRLAWVTSPKIYKRWKLMLDGKDKVLVSHHFDEAEKGLGSWISPDKVEPYTDERWAACQDWINRRTQLGIDYEVLKRGKQPKQALSKSVVPWQASLLEAA